MYFLIYPINLKLFYQKFTKDYSVNTADYKFLLGDLNFRMDATYEEALGHIESLKKFKANN